MPRLTRRESEGPLVRRVSVTRSKPWLRLPLGSGKSEPRESRASRPAGVPLPPAAVQSTSEEGTASPVRVFALVRQASLVILILGLCASLVFLLRDPRFQIHVIELAGNQEVPADEILRRAPVAGSNLFFVREEPIARELLALPRVRSASVTRGLPDRLRVAIEERHAVAVLRAGKVEVEIDGDGVVLGPVAGKPELPRIDLPGALPPVPGSRLDPDMLPRVEELRRALAAELELKSAPIDYEPDGSLLVRGPDWIANFGSLPHPAERVPPLKALLQQAQQQRLPHGYVDLRTSSPYLRAAR